jgi:hypothetical protein
VCARNRPEDAEADARSKEAMLLEHVTGACFAVGIAAYVVVCVTCYDYGVGYRGTRGATPAWVERGGPALGRKGAAKFRSATWP